MSEDDYEDIIKEFYESMKNYTKEQAEQDKKDMKKWEKENE